MKTQAAFCVIDGKVYDEVDVDGEKGQYRVCAKEVVVLKCDGGESFDSVYGTFSRNIREYIESHLEDATWEKLIPVLQHTYVKATPVLFYLLYAVVWFLSLTMIRLKWRRKVVVKPGVYDTGRRIPTTMLISSLESIKITTDVISFVPYIT